MTEGTTSAGGYGIPVLIDPSIILTSQAADAPLLQVARVIEITTNIWHGVSSAGVSWAYQAEGSTVADDSPTLAQPTVTTYMARGFIPYSIEVGQDYVGFAEEISMLLSPATSTCSRRSPPSAPEARAQRHLPRDHHVGHHDRGHHGRDLGFGRRDRAVRSGP